MKKTLIAIAALSLMGCADAASKGGSGESAGKPQACCGIDPGENIRNNTTNPTPGGGNNTVEPPVSRTKVLSELTDDERDELCATVDQVAGANVDRICNFTGVITAGFSQAESDEQLQAACEENRQSCADDFDAECDIPNCEATVDQLVACYNEVLEFYSQEVPQCSDLTLEMLSEFNQDEISGPEAGPACAAYNNACDDEQPVNDINNVPTPDPDPIEPQPANSGTGTNNSGG